MERRVAFLGRDYLIPAASMTVFDTIAIVVMIPIYDGIVQPLMKQLRCELSLLQRIGWGFVLAALAMLSAALVERRRMAAIAEGGNVTVMQQVTPYLLVGASEVLSSIGQIEFFYDQVRRLRALGVSRLAFPSKSTFRTFVLLRRAIANRWHRVSVCVRVHKNSGAVDRLAGDLRLGGCLRHSALACRRRTSCAPAAPRSPS